MGQEPLTVLYDRDCTLCTWTAAQIRRLDGRGRVTLVPLQEAGRRPARPEVATAAATHDLHRAVHVIDASGTVSAGGAAMLQIARVLPGGTVVSAWSRIPGARLVAEAFYSLVARNRGAIGRLAVPGGGTCPAPAEEPGSRRRAHQEAAASDLERRAA